MPALHRAQRARQGGGAVQQRNHLTEPKAHGRVVWLGAGRLSQHLKTIFGRGELVVGVVVFIL